MSRLKDKDIDRRVSLCKALFLAPSDIFSRVDRYIEISIDTFIDHQTGQRPSKNFPLDFWPKNGQEPLDEDPTKIMANLTDKDAKDRAALCKVLFLAPASMIRDIERYFAVCLHSFIEDKTGKKPSRNNPMDLYIHRTPYNGL